MSNASFNYKFGSYVQTPTGNLGVIRNITGKTGERIFTLRMEDGETAVIRESSVRPAGWDRAVQLANSLPQKTYRRASADSAIPYFGANFDGFGPMVMWLKSDDYLSVIMSDGEIEIPGGNNTAAVFCFAML